MQKLLLLFFLGSYEKIKIMQLTRMNSHVSNKNSTCKSPETILNAKIKLVNKTELKSEETRENKEERNVILPSKDCL